jgi:hypothetical protein
MGLDAVVYKRWEGVAEKQKRSVRLVDQATGEIEYIDDRLESSDQKDGLLAASVCFGNISHIAELRACLQILMSSENSIILNKFVYDGSHSGDIIRSGDFPAIEVETAFLRQQRQISPELAHFLNQLTELIEVATRELNPIVFI